jgi:hypothetical protein
LLIQRDLGQTFWRCSITALSAVAASPTSALPTN